MVGLGLIAAFAGCYRHAYAVSGTVPEARPRADRWDDHYLLGLVDADTDIELREICPQGIARIESAQEPAQVLVSVLTLFIYTPRSVRVYCIDTAATDVLLRAPE